MSVLVLTKDSTSPSITGTITSGGAPVNLTGSTVKFRMRLAASSSATFKVDATASIVSPTAGTVQYDWAAVDTDTAGEYVCWWQVIFPSNRKQDAPEGIIIISSHAPGSTVDLCTIADVGVAFSLPTPTDDQLVQTLITAASRAIMARYNREFTPQADAATRTYRVDNGIVDLVAHDLRAATTVTLDPNGTPKVLAAGTDYKLLPINGSSLGTFTHVALSRQLTVSSSTTTNFGFGELQILGNFGAFSTATVPEDIRRAAVETVGSWIDRAASQYASQPSLGDQSFAARPDRFSGWGIPATAHRILSQYERVVV